jgi:hypothetical protein
MGFSSRILLVDQSDRVYRLGMARFAVTLRNPAQQRLLLFAGQRVRLVNVFVQLRNGKPIRVARMTYHVLNFDGTGCLHVELFRRQEASRYEAWFDSRIAALGRSTNAKDGVVDASSRFIMRGSLWVPSRSLQHALRQAALGRIRVPRV